MKISISSTNFISQSKYSLKACNFRIKELLPAEEATGLMITSLLTDLGPGYTILDYIGAS